jgi:hypothetical protein
MGGTNYQYEVQTHTFVLSFGVTTPYKIWAQSGSGYGVPANCAQIIAVKIA